MKYIYTENISELYPLQEAVLNAMPTKNGLWLPEKLPKINIKNLLNKTFHEVAFHILQHFFNEEMTPDILKNIIKEAFNFEIPLVHFKDNIFILELFHGPTYTFKDIGCRFMAIALKHIISEKYKDKKINVIVATSGDTGSAVANAFYNIPNITVNIFYPKNRISKLQEKQMTTLGGNIKAFCVDGDFDDCQNLIKNILGDKLLMNNYFFFPANSINILRLLPQTIYYFWAYIQLNKVISSNTIHPNIYFSIPSGNLGNACAGVICKKMGLPIDKFIIATNNNDAFGRYLDGKSIDNIISVKTLSTAMDISVPNNLIRLKYLYDNNIENFKKDMCSYSIDNHKTIEYMKKSQQNGYIMDPHTSVGYAALDTFISENKHKGTNNYYILIDTAHPAKFPNTMKLARIELIIPLELLNLLISDEQKKDISTDYNTWKSNFMKLNL